MTRLTALLQTTRGRFAAGFLALIPIGIVLAVVLSSGQEQDGFQGQRPLASGSPSASNDQVRGLGLAADERSSASASAAAKASISANADLKSASELAARMDAASQARARALHSRSRDALKRAVAKTKKLAAAADSAQEIRVGAKTVTRISSALGGDAALQAKIALSAEGRLESQAAAALVSDVRMQQAIITAGLKMAGDAGAKTLNVALNSSTQATQQLVIQADAAADVAAASPARVSTEAQAEAELAIALATRTLADTTTLVSAIVADIALDAQASSRVAFEASLEGLTEAGAQIAALVKKADIAGNAVTLTGVGNTTLGALSHLGAQVTASASLSAGTGTQDMAVRLDAAGRTALAILGR